MKAGDLEKLTDETSIDRYLYLLYGLFAIAIILLLSGTLVCAG